MNNGVVLFICNRKLFNGCFITNFISISFKAVGIKKKTSDYMPVFLVKKILYNSLDRFIKEQNG